MKALLLTLSLLLPAVAAAHGLLLKASWVDDEIVGTLSYSDGTVAVGEFVELRLASAAADGEATDVARTDAEGRFSLQGTPGQDYRVVAYGEEGHTTTVGLTPFQGRQPTTATAPADARIGASNLLMLVAPLLIVLLFAAVWRWRRRS